MKKKIIIIVSLLIVLVIGVTYAWWNWQSSTNTNVTFNVEGASVTYSAGNNISGIKLIPVSSKEKGVTDNTAVYKEITASSNKTMYLTLNMALTTFPSNLADASLVWEIYKGNTKIGNGNFSGKSQGNTITLFENQEINSTESLYKLYIWIDGNQDNPNTMMNQDFVFTLNATATDEAPTRLMAQPVEFIIEQCEAADSPYTKCRTGEEYSVESSLYKSNILGKEFDTFPIINRIITVANKNIPANAVDSWDVSESQNGGVMAWLIKTNAYCQISEMVMWNTPRYYDKEYCDANVSNYDENYYVDNKEYRAYILDEPVYELYIGQNGGVVANPNSSYLFDGYGVTEIDLSNFDTSNVINMRNMFANNYGLEILNLGTNFDTSNVTNMAGMFSGLESLVTLNLGNNFDTSNVTDMSEMFYSMRSLTNLVLGSKFDTSNVVNMRGMFRTMDSLTTLNLGSKFDTSSVTDMAEMFQGMNSLTTLNLGNSFDTSSVTDMTGMFALLDSLTTLNLGNNFDTINVEYMRGMFYNTNSITTLNLGSKFNTSNVINMESMFESMSSLTTIYTALDFDISNISKQWNGGIFGYCSNLVGGNNTAYNSANTSGSYAKIDRPGTPGYFTDIAVLNS